MTLSEPSFSFGFELGRLWFLRFSFGKVPPTGLWVMEELEDPGRGAAVAARECNLDFGTFWMTQLLTRLVINLEI